MTKNGLITPVKCIILLEIVVKKPLFSIIIASYNSSKTISTAIESVVTQAYPAIELIIVDGASTDGTVEIIKQYSDKYPHKIKWLSEPDDGIYCALNKGIDLAEGDIIGVLGSDDSYLPNVFEAVSYEFMKGGLKVTYGLVNLYKKNIHIEVLGVHYNSLTRRMIPHQSIFVSKDIHIQYGKYNTNFKIAGDYDFMLRIKDKEDIEFVYLGLPIANYSVDGISAMNAMRSHLEAEKARYTNGIYAGRLRYRINLLKLLIIFSGKSLAYNNGGNR